ncbi:MAG: P-II family nitrogen regulator [Halobacteriota archaeon]
MTITRVEGHGQQKGLIEQFRGREFKVELLPKINLEDVVIDAIAHLIYDLVFSKSYTSEWGAICKAEIKWRKR